LGRYFYIGCGKEVLAKPWHRGIGIEVLAKRYQKTLAKPWQRGIKRPWLRPWLRPWQRGIKRPWLSLGKEVLQKLFINILLLLL
jgi:hypothetical protein